MIEPLAEVIRTRILAPQLEATNPLHRVWPDEDDNPIDTYPATGSVIPFTSTPIGVELAGGMESGQVVIVRHVLALTVKVVHGSRAEAEAMRNPIVLDLMRRALLVDWQNLPELADEPFEVQRTSWGVDYADLDTTELAAYATLSFTIDTEWTV